MTMESMLGGMNNGRRGENENYGEMDGSGF